MAAPTRPTIPPLNLAGVARATGPSSSPRELGKPLSATKKQDRKVASLAAPAMSTRKHLSKPPLPRSADQTTLTVTPPTPKAEEVEKAAQAARASLCPKK